MESSKQEELHRDVVAITMENNQNNNDDDIGNGGVRERALQIEQEQEQERQQRLNRVISILRTNVTNSHC
jgi:hypothetical protein